MSTDPLYIIDTEEPTRKNRFPIVAQLGVLSFVLLLLFGATLLPSDTTPEPPDTQIVTITPNEQPLPIPQKIAEVNIRGTAAHVFDVQAQRSLYTKNADEALPIASITKLMTALLAYELVADEKQATVSQAAVRQDGFSGLSVGEQLAVEELRNLALISSSNDAAYALAANVGLLLGERDPAAQFIQGMNIRAKELQLNSFQFWNTTGLDLSETQPGAIGSAKDVSFLMEYIIKNHPELLAPTQETATRIYNTAGAYHDVNNTNAVALEIPNMIGSKTGYTDLAGGNLTVAFDLGLNRPIIVTVLGSTRDDRFTDVLTLIEAVQNTVSIE